MKLTLKLYASLSDLLPPGAMHNTAQIEAPDSATLNWVIDEYRVPSEMAHLVLVNGVFVCARERENPTLKEGDSVAIWPPVAGGWTRLTGRIRPLIEEAFSREFGLTHKEFFRSLPPVMKGMAVQIETDKVTGMNEGRQVTISLEPEQIRKIALLEIPYTILNFSFEGFSPGEREDFMRRFDLYFRRGGG